MSRRLEEWLHPKKLGAFLLGGLVLHLTNHYVGPVAVKYIDRVGGAAADHIEVVVIVILGVVVWDSTVTYLKLERIDSKMSKDIRADGGDLDGAARRGSSEEGRKIRQR